MANAPDFILRSELHGHSQDVRCMQYTTINNIHTIISGSRDRTIRVWRENSVDSKKIYEEALCLKGHEKYVSAVAYLQPHAGYTDGIIFSGGLDNTIRAHNAVSGEFIFKLTGHTSQITCLAVDDSRHLLISGSSDTSMRAWRNTELVQEFKGHEMVVWALLVVGQATNEVGEMSLGCKLPFVLSASADKTIRLWAEGKVIRTFTGHSDCVRCLAELDEIHFLSAGNDATIRQWNRLNGECIKTFVSSDFVYSVACLPGNEYFLSGGEDKALKVWTLEKNDCAQSILLPAQSVWSVVFLQNGDVACGSSDGMIRIFTTAKSRQAPTDSLAAFDANVQAFHKVTNMSDEIGGIKKSDIPGPEALLNPGNRDGQYKMVRVRDRVEVYSWSLNERKWQKIGEVLDEKKDDEKQGENDKQKSFEGTNYDYVFDVDFEDGKPVLKLPYNIGEDPWRVAQTFLHKNFLPQDYLEKVANFIKQNTKFVPEASTVDSHFEDPFTGVSRYKPATNGTSSGFPTNGDSDPVTGSGRYVPGINGSVVFDPKKNDPKRPRGERMPLKTYIKFDTYSEVLMNKLEENNKKLSDKSLNLTPSHFEALKAFVQQKKSSCDFSLVFQSIDRMMSWDGSYLPPCIDLLRLTILDDKIYEHYFKCLSSVSSFVNNLCNLMCGEEAALGLLVFGCRALANAVAMGCMGFMVKEPQLLLVAVKKAIECSLLNKPTAQIAATSLLANIAFAFLENGDDLTYVNLKHEFALNLIEFSDLNRSKLDTVDQQALMLLLQSLLTLLWGDENFIANVAQQNRFRSQLQRFKDIAFEDSVKNVARSLEHMLF